MTHYILRVANIIARTHNHPHFRLKLFATETTLLAIIFSVYKLNLIIILHNPKSSRHFVPNFPARNHNASLFSGLCLRSSFELGGK